jgi:four helix bundle protein
VAGARHFTDLVVRQLADQLRVHVFRVTARSPLRTDFKLRSQLDDAADSVCRNIAEGFGAQSNREFARFVRIARRSWNEVQDCFRSALIKRYLVHADLVDARRLLRWLYPAIGSLLAHLDSGRD